MNIERALTARLLASPILNPQIGNRVVWSAKDGKAALPSITLSMAGEDRVYNHDSADDLQSARIQFDVRSTRYDDVATISRLVLSEMEKSDTKLGIKMLSAELVYSADDDAETTGSGTVVLKRIMDFMVSYRSA